jgi:tRNA U38,U39,U40 pseudouridine synthase TruA
LRIERGLLTADPHSAIGTGSAIRNPQSAIGTGSAIRNPQSAIGTGSAIRNPQSAMLCYEITGTGFLRHMVRAIVGSLIEVGRGRRAVEWMAQVLASRDRAEAGPTAPAHGLFLVSVDYGGGV